MKTRAHRSDAQHQFRRPSLIASLCRREGRPIRMMLIAVTVQSFRTVCQIELEDIEAKLMAWHRADECSRRLARIPAVGPIGASLLMNDLVQHGEVHLGVMAVVSIHRCRSTVPTASSEAPAPACWSRRNAGGDWRLVTARR